jgi:iduronate 2-sulfatase
MTAQGRLSTIISLLLLFIWSAEVLVSSTSSSSGRKHNILFVVVDDLPMTVEPYLDPSHPLKQKHVSFTPNIQALAEESIVFHRAYVQNAACNPSRASMLTSRNPIELQLFTKFPFKKKTNTPITMPFFFRSTHYVVGTGKIFHSEWPTQFNKYIRVDTGDTVCGNGKEECILPEISLVDNQVTLNALNLIKGAPKNKPWFALVGYHRPHWMYSTTQANFDSVDVIESDLRAQIQQTEALGALQRPDFATNGAPPFASAVQKDSAPSSSVAKATETRKWVYAATQWMDECLGRLLQGLKSQMNNTIVILTSDNGVMMFDRSQSGKSVLFNAAKRVPFLLRHPDYMEHAQGKRTAAMVELMDIFPTLVEMEGLEPLPGMTGTSLVPLLKLLNTASASEQYYSASTKLGSITIETRCTTADPSVLSKVPSGSKFTGDWIACHQLNNAASNRVEMFGVSIQTAKFNYVEWRVAQYAGFSQKEPRWDTAGLWSRELYDFAEDDGLTRINSVEFEGKNLAPCDPDICFPRNLNFPKTRDNLDGNFRLGNDYDDVEYDPPDMDSISTPYYREVVQRLSLALRAIVRDRTPVCSGHGTINPKTWKCDQCIGGWYGDQCEIPKYIAFANEAFPFPPTTSPTASPTGHPTNEPTNLPTRRPTPEPTRNPSKSPTISKLTSQPTFRPTVAPRTPFPRPRG